MYSVYVSDLELIIRLIHGLRVVQFADDLCLFTSHSSSIRMIDILEEGARLLRRFLILWGLIYPPRNLFSVYLSIIRLKILSIAP